MKLPMFALTRQCEEEEEGRRIVGVRKKIDERAAGQTTSGDGDKANSYREDTGCSSCSSIF